MPRPALSFPSRFQDRFDIETVSCGLCLANAPDVIDDVILHHNPILPVVPPECKWKPDDLQMFATRLASAELDSAPIISEYRRDCRADPNRFQLICQLLNACVELCLHGKAV